MFQYLGSKQLYWVDPNGMPYTTSPWTSLLPLTVEDELDEVDKLDAEVPLILPSHTQV